MGTEKGSEAEALFDRLRMLSSILVVVAGVAGWAGVLLDSSDLDGTDMAVDLGAAAVTKPSLTVDMSLVRAKGRSLRAPAGGERNSMRDGSSSTTALATGPLFRKGIGPMDVVDTALPLLLRCCWGLGRCWELLVVLYLLGL